MAQFTAKQKSYFIAKGMGKLDPRENELLKFYELNWHLRHRVPTIEEVAEFLKLRQVEVNYLLTKASVVKALDKRGIPWRQHSQDELTATQVAAAVTIMNSSDTRTNAQKLDQLGINPATYQAWLNDPQFRNLVQSVADTNLRNIDPVAKTEYAKLINQGDWQAVKHYLDNTGVLKNDQVPQSEELIKMFVEIIQKYVKDPEIMTAIAADILAVSANRTLVAHTPPQLLGELVEEDEELEEAKRKLGVM